MAFQPSTRYSVHFAARSLRGDFMALAIPWSAMEEILACLHGATSEFSLHMFALLLVQGLYRQAACGKTGLTCFRLADTLDCVLCNLAGGKSNQYDEHGYGKRLACNDQDAKFCFPTALGRHIFSRTANEDSPYIFMREEDAERHRNFANSSLGCFRLDFK